MQVSFTVDDVVAVVKPRAQRGGTRECIRGIAALSVARPGDLSFLGNSKYKTQVPASRASVLLLPPDFAGEPAPDQLFLLVDNPSAALASICARIEQSLWPRPAPGIHPTAVVAQTARVAASATIGPFCVIEDGAVVGERTQVGAHGFIGRAAQLGQDCWLMPGVRVLTECVLADRVRLHAGVVIGSDGFGYEFAGGRHEKVPQVGLVDIGSDVEIGANTTVDRARFGRTMIGEGTKIDNLVQIAHNVVIGRHCLLCAQVGISGSTTLEDYVVLGGQAGVGGHITIGKAAKAAGQTGITADVEPGLFVKGNPSMPFQLEQRLNVLRRRLPDLFERVQSIESELAELKKSSA